MPPCTKPIAIITLIPVTTTAIPPTGSTMSDDESSVSSSDEDQPMEFNPWLVGDGESVTYLKDLHDLEHVPGEELDQLLSEKFDALVFEGHASREFKEYGRVLYLLQNCRRWRTIALSDRGPERATPEFLSLVVLALTKTNQVSLSDCPMDENFFACLNSGMPTLTHMKMISSSILISYEGAAMFANGLAFSRSIERLEIQRNCWFEPGAGLKMVDGIKRNKSLKDLTIHEENLGKVAMISLLRAVSEGCIPKLATLHIELKHESDCTDVLTKLMSSETCRVEDLTVIGNLYSPNMIRTSDVRTGKPNLKLKSLSLTNTLLDESYWAKILPMMPALSSLTLRGCEISDVSPIVDHLCLPNTAIKSIDLSSNKIGIDQAEKFVESLTDMQSLTDVNIHENPWSRDRSVGTSEERIQKMIKKVSTCCNLEKFRFFESIRFHHFRRMTWPEKHELSLNMAINRAWRRELCFKNSSPPSKLLPLVIARALRRTKDGDLRADVILSLLRERMSDLIPVHNS